MAIAPAEEVLEFLKKAHDEFQPLSEKMIFDKNHPLQRNTISLYEKTGSETEGSPQKSDHNQ